MEHLHLPVAVDACADTDRRHAQALREQFRERRALPLIDAGNLAGAVAAISSIWASLPGSPYGQHTQSMADIQSAYLAAGGTLAT